MESGLKAYKKVVELVREFELEYDIISMGREFTIKILEGDDFNKRHAIYDGLFEAKIETDQRDEKLKKYIKLLQVLLENGC